MTDTIYALSSGPVPCGVAVIRITGPLAGKAIELFTPRLPPARQAALRALRGADGQVIDYGLVLWFPGPRSETGENMAELQLHGGKAVVQGVFAVLSEAGLRLAEPGEFVRRAFQNGKLELTAVEGLADLIAAETEVQRRQAVQQAGGALTKPAERWRETLIDLRAEIEAQLDFSDEGDVAEGLPAEFWLRLAALKSEMEAAIRGTASAERVREGFRVAILGIPNAGKSSLLNALARRDVAIVTSEAGTTRDVLEVPLDLNGYPVVLYDTAGLRNTASAAEVEGVRRARRTADQADLILWLSDSENPSPPPPDLPPISRWTVCTKIDLAPPSEGADAAISVVSGAGLAELSEKLAEIAGQSLGPGNALVTRRRQKDMILQALDALNAIENPGHSASGTPDPFQSGSRPPKEEITADLLRSASDAIGRLTGRVGVEDVLDRLFREFCIGK